MTPLCANCNSSIIKTFMGWRHRFGDWKYRDDRYNCKKPRPKEEYGPTNRYVKETLRRIEALPDRSNYKRPYSGKSRISIMETARRKRKKKKVKK